MYNVCNVSMAFNLPTFSRANYFRRTFHRRPPSLSTSTRRQTTESGCTPNYNQQETTPGSMLQFPARPDFTHRPTISSPHVPAYTVWEVSRSQNNTSNCCCLLPPTAYVPQHESFHAQMQVSTMRSSSPATALHPKRSRTSTNIYTPRAATCT